MKILVLFTGGTIGSVENDGYISTSNEPRYQLIEHYKNTKDASVEFVTDCPYTILSEQLNGDYINNLVSCIKKHLQARETMQEVFDGIIVTHGTDTLQYTAAALGLSFSKIDIPMVLVSSNYILEDSRANGHANFSGAVSFIKYCLENYNISDNTRPVFDYPRVTVSYRNGFIDGEVLFHDGLQLLPHNIYSDDIKSFDGNEFGRIYESFSEDPDTVKHIPLFTPFPFEILQDLYISENSTNGKTVNVETLSSKSLSKTSPVLPIKVTPGFPFSANILTGFDDCNSLKNTLPKAILIESYHSGTLPTEDESFLHFVEVANKLNLPIYLIGMEDRTQYESTKKYDSLGLKILPKLSSITAYMWLWYQYSDL